jgi:hypothetical protein
MRPLVLLLLHPLQQHTCSSSSTMRCLRLIQQQQ